MWVFSLPFPYGIWRRISASRVMVDPRDGENFSIGPIEKPMH